MSTFFSALLQCNWVAIISIIFGKASSAAWTFKNANLMVTTATIVVNNMVGTPTWSDEQLHLSLCRHTPLQLEALRLQYTDGPGPVYVQPQASVVQS